MPALSPRDLASACRTIYVRAAGDTILPPLIRDAADPAPPQRTIEAAGAAFALKFCVLFADVGADPSGRPARPPLRFEIEAVAGPDDAAVTLTAAERGEMIRAYLLGVADPLVVDAPGEGGDWRIGLRIAPRFVLPAAEPVRLEAGLSTDEICRRLAARLFETTAGLFGSRAAGLEVWEARLREELFGEGRRLAHEIWPPVEIAAPLPLVARLPAPARAPADRSHAGAPRRRALAAACALVGLAALAGALASREAGGALRAPRHPEVSQSAKEPGGSPRTLPAIRLAALERQDVDPPAAGDVRFALLAPTVAQAVFSLSPGGVAAPQATATGPRAETLPAGPVPSAVQPRKAKSAAHLRRPRKPGAFARVDRAVKQFVKKIGAKLPRVKLTALNSPQADGPGRN